MSPTVLEAAVLAFAATRERVNPSTKNFLYASENLEASSNSSQGVRSSSSHLLLSHEVNICQIRFEKYFISSSLRPES